ncbi:hypothetical protein GCM10010334_76830 [Streptomyces finlayi]|uniref:Uncharacterized protein n=2 Tax=Streptomyces finlayi TaxID=67296 RepID=A0A918X722_9ACTN|nr:hypothetical protein GCM10010334_76830 [Streptomyces finlayi]
MSDMPDAPPLDIPPASYATAAQQRAYITAMQRIRDARQPADPIRVYISVPPQIARRPAWGERIARIQSRLPHAQLLQFPDLFTPEDYAEKWPDVAPTLDGLVIVGATTNGATSTTYKIGQVARLEIIDIVRRGRPVLIHARRYGLVPVVDCQVRRIGDTLLRTKITVPSGWDPADYEPTLKAARQALGRAPEADAQSQGANQ